MTLNSRLTPLALALVALCVFNNAKAAIGLDRTRVIFDGSKDAVSMSITNNNTQLPYLAHGWIENEQGNKITTPLTVLPRSTAGAWQAESSKGSGIASR